MALIKKYERQTGSELILSQYNPPKELRFAIETVKSIHLIVNPGEASQPSARRAVRWIAGFA